MMKYFFTLLVLMLPILGIAQVHNAENYNPGDQLHYMICTMPDSPGSAGTSIIWDFHAQQDSGNGQRTTWVLYDSTTGDIFLSSNPVPISGSKIHKTTTQNFLTTTLAPPATYTYDAGVLLIDRTLTYGLMDSNAYSSSIAVAANTLTGSGTSKIVVDGIGTVMTPVGTFNNAVRVKRTVDNIDSVTGTSLRNLQVSYLWYDSLHTAPLFRIDSLYRVGTGFLQPNTITTGTAEYLQAIFPAGIRNIEQSKITATAHLSDKGLLLNAALNSGTTYSLGLFNISGQKLYGNTFIAEGSIQHFDLNVQLPAGTYVLVVAYADGSGTPIVTRLINE